MWAIGSPRLRQLELWWVVFAAANLGAMALSPRWETIPFHLIWFTLTVLYGFAVWPHHITAIVLAVIAVLTGGLILDDASHGTQTWGELFEVPLMSAMFLAMVWHARRRVDAMDALAEESAKRAEMLTRHESFLHDVSHELRTPITIARGHLEIVERGGAQQEVAVALDELGRMERIVERLLLLAKAQSAGFETTSVDIGVLIEDLVMRWAEITPRVWRVGELPDGTLCADPDALRAALDALVENAVQHTEPTAVIELSARAAAGDLSIEVADEGGGIPPDALERIFDRFARVDVARTRDDGGVGLGLAIVDAIARAHGGSCHVRATAGGSTFALVIPGFRAAEPGWAAVTAPAPAAVAPFGEGGSA
jgi:signal transduction histidine kinase